MRTRIGRIAALSTLAYGALAGAGALAQNSNGLNIEVLSSLPTMVTGGDALAWISTARNSANVDLKSL